jgi:hypothetical protein
VLNLEFQHFIPRFDKNFVTWQIPLKEGFVEGERRPKEGFVEDERRPKDRVKTGCDLMDKSISSGAQYV